MGRIAWLLAGGGVLVALTGAGALALTQPSIATPFARMILGGDRATLGRAWVSYGPLPVAHLRTLEIEGRGHAEAIDARINPLGLLPGVALLPQVSVDAAALLLELGPDRGSKPPGILGEMVDVDLTEVRLDIHRPERAPQTLMIAKATGDLASGGFQLQGSGGSATLVVEGEAAGLSLDGFRGEIRLEGENFATLAAVLGFAAPDTPPFSLTGELRRSGETWAFGPFSGDVGDSDLAGELQIDFAGEKPFVRADLRSRSLDFDDLGVIVGAPSDVEGGEANARQEEIRAQYAEDDGRAIPNTELDLDRLAAVNADVTFRADSVRAGMAPLEGIDAHITIEDSVLRFDRLIFSAPQGRLDATGEIDASDPDAVVGALQGSLEDFELGQVASGRILRGGLTAEFDLTFAGRRMRDAFASLSGDVAAWSTDAEIRALFEEAAGVDIGEVLGRLLTESDEAPVFRVARCLVAKATVEDGVARVDPAVLDTEDSVTRLRGLVDFRTEALDLEIASDAKDFSWGTLFGGVGLGGTLRDPATSAPLGAAALQAGAAALLSGLTAGLAALPFVEPGLGEDAPCGRLLEAAEQTNDASEGAED